MSGNGQWDAPGLLLSFEIADHLDAWFGACADAGVKYIQMSGIPGFLDASDTVYRSRIELLLSRHALVPHSFHMCFPFVTQHPRWCPQGVHCNFGTPDPIAFRDAVAYYKEVAAIAIGMGFRVLVTHVTDFTWWPSGIPRSEARRRALDGIRAVAGSVEAWGGAIAIENLPQGEFDATGEGLRAFIEECGGGPLGVCLDTGHAHLAGDAPRQVRALPGLIQCTHIHDNHGGKDEHLMPMEGTLDWSALLRAFGESRYAGPFIYETAPKQADPARPDLSKLMENFKALMAKGT